MRITRTSTIVSAVSVVALLLAGCAAEPRSQSAAERLVNAQGQTGGQAEASAPGGVSSSPEADDSSPSASSTDDTTDDTSDDTVSDAATPDDDSSSTATGHGESESPEAHASASSTRSSSPRPSATATRTPRPTSSPTSHGGGGGGVQADRIKVSKCFTNATSSTGGELLIKASSSDPRARLVAYSSDGSLLGEVQNGGGSRYGGTVMPYQKHDPGTCVIKSSSGGTITVPTTPFHL